MQYERSDSFAFDFEPNGNPFGSKSKAKPSYIRCDGSHSTQFEMKWKSIFPNDWPKRSPCSEVYFTTGVAFHAKAAKRVPYLCSFYQ